MERRLVYLALKRVFDLLFSLFAIVALAIPMLMIAALIKADSKGPALFKQVRVGQNRKPFIILKFRSMYLDTDPNAPTHQLTDAMKHITRVGRIIRKYSIDELPQLFNIFVGEMSFVGPRPALWNQTDLILERERYGANDIKPGLTGLAQISGRDELGIPAKAALDGQYVKKRSCLFDIKLFFLTFLIVFNHTGFLEGNSIK